MRDFPELAFNAFRLVIASGIFLAALWWQRRPRDAERPGTRSLSRTDWHATGVSGPGRSSLLPVAVPWRREAHQRRQRLADHGHDAGRRRLADGVDRTRTRAAAAVARRRHLLRRPLHRRRPEGGWSASGHLGDLLVFGSVVCWATYSVAPCRCSGSIRRCWSRATRSRSARLLYLLVSVPTLVRRGLGARSHASAGC